MSAIKTPGLSVNQGKMAAVPREARETRGQSRAQEENPCLVAGEKSIFLIQTFLMKNLMPPTSLVQNTTFQSGVLTHLGFIDHH